MYSHEPSEYEIIKDSIGLYEYEQMCTSLRLEDYQKNNGIFIYDENGNSYELVSTFVYDGTLQLTVKEKTDLIYLQ